MDGPIADALGAHPYYPLGVSIPTYVANTMNAAVLVSIFAAGCGIIFVPTYLFAVRTRPSISFGEVLIAFWWVLCGCYFSYNHFDMASKTDLFGQLWKEYSLSDSRYMTQDPFVVCMETVTAFLWGPLSFFIAYATITNHSWRHPMQLLVSMGQMYGDILYYVICWYNEIVNGIAYSRPERYYYWAYFVLCNAFWIAIPLGLIGNSVKAVAKAFDHAKAMNGSVKKHQ
ncbi:emopamil-binding protein [Pochonia chlamydosporia 170]|uniref:Emopamil-binding protein n=1 Tax=Pochonia chlamydosporia 170 TaxID=1380566 RepID=A0A179FWM4_METCM|nr:emopamil-binding protein [Pochonia chlamydosporia 170]OAQ69767.1 emopamil-binding protein [Pochonia chlamydosporia 170]